MEASLFRIEAKLWALRVRIEPNIHSGIGLRDGQVQVKLAGFGLSFGNYGIGVSTPLGGIGSGKFWYGAEELFFTYVFVHVKYNSYKIIDFIHAYHVICT